MGSALLEFFADNCYYPEVRRIGVPDHFIQHGPVKELYKICGMDEDSICNAILSFNNEQKEK